MNLVIFDFCETLVNFQTADSFVDFILHQSGRKKRKFSKLMLSVLHRLRLIVLINKLFPSFNLSKRLCLYQLRGLPTLEMTGWNEAFVTEKIRPNLIPELMLKLKEHQQAGDYILLISGGYEDYLNVFAQQENIPSVMGTIIERKNNRLTGFFEKADCLNKEKVNRLNIWLSTQKKQFDSTFVYSDSISDMPLFKYVDYPIVVSKNRSQLWVQEHKFSEIIYKHL
jgi:HAD superfamily hydrolase (TIGR01490 family)